MFSSIDIPETPNSDENVPGARTPSGVPRGSSSGGCVQKSVRDCHSDRRETNAKRRDKISHLQVPSTEKIYLAYDSETKYAKLIF